MTSLFYDPWIAQRLWRRMFVGARQPLRLSFELSDVGVDGARARVREDDIDLAPLAKLRRFRLEAPQADASAPTRRFLLSPPYSGAFSVMLRDVAATLLPHGEVYALDWMNVGRTLTAAPRFDFDDQTAVLRDAMAVIGGGAHVVAVCQAGPPTLIAAALHGEDESGHAPASISLLSAPLKPNAAPSVVSESIRSRSLEWFRKRITTRVSAETGEHRAVYPAEAQMKLMMSTLAAQSPSRDELSRLIARDDGDAPSRLSFLEIVTAYMDLPAEHFLTSLDRIYMSAEGPLAPMRWRDRVVSPDALRRVALAAVEGENDRVAAPGQTFAAFDALPSEDGVARRRILVEKLGHFALFYGGGWRERVAPRMMAFIRQVERAQARRPAATSALSQTSSQTSSAAPSQSVSQTPAAPQMAARERSMATAPA